MTGIDRSPAPVARWIAVAAGVVAAASVGLYTWSGLVVGTIGLLVLVVGVALGRSTTVSAGGGILLVGVIGGAAEGAPAAVVIAAAVATIVAWDAGRYAIDLGAQLGHDTPTTRIELVHTAATGLVGVLTAGIGYGIFRSVTTGQPLIALVYLLLAALFVSLVLR